MPQNAKILLRTITKTLFYWFISKKLWHLGIIIMKICFYYFFMRFQSVSPSFSFVMEKALCDKQLEQNEQNSVNSFEICMAYWALFLAIKQDVTVFFNTLPKEVASLMKLSMEFEQDIKIILVSFTSKISY